MTFGKLLQKVDGEKRRASISFWSVHSSSAYPCPCSEHPHTMEYFILRTPFLMFQELQYFVVILLVLVE